MDKIEFNAKAVKKSESKLHFDPLEYVQYLDGMDLSDKEAQEVLSVLWDMMVQFVDLGLRVDYNSGRCSQIAAHDSRVIEGEAKRKPHKTHIEETRL